MVWGGNTWWAGTGYGSESVTKAAERPLANYRISQTLVFSSVKWERGLNYDFFFPNISCSHLTPKCFPLCKPPASEKQNLLKHPREVSVGCWLWQICGNSFFQFYRDSSGSQQRCPIMPIETWEVPFLIFLHCSSNPEICWVEPTAGLRGRKKKKKKHYIWGRGKLGLSSEMLTSMPKGLEEMQRIKNSLWTRKTSISL